MKKTVFTTALLAPFVLYGLLTLFKVHIFELVPKDFKIPESCSFDTYVIHRLTLDYSKLDYIAVMSSAQRLRKESLGMWPSKDFTLEDNIKDIKQKEYEFKHRYAFTYTVLNKSKDKCIDCIYIFYNWKPWHDAIIYLWAEESELKKGFELLLKKNTKQWIQSKWPFKRVEYAF